MTYTELEETIHKILPGAQLETDNYGQIIIYTDLTETPDGTLGVFDEGEVPRENTER